MNSRVSPSPNNLLGFYGVKMCGSPKSEHIEEKVLFNTIEGNNLFRLSDTFYRNIFEKAACPSRFGNIKIILIYIDRKIDIKTTV